MGDEAPPLTVRSQKPIKELENVKLPGKVTVEVGNLRQVPELYAQADVALFPSKYEGVGISLIEAQGCGLPVITSDLEPMKSIAPEFLVSGQAGEIEIMEGHRVPTCTAHPIAIAGRVKDLHHVDISDASKRARFRAQERYSWAALKDQWINLLESV
jgi:glycosyltransferase involved in cell wall biosynthesis